MTPTQKLTVFLAFGFGVGKLPKAPGTFGTLVGVGLYLILQAFGLSTIEYAGLVSLLFALGIWLCHEAEKILDVPDHPGIVWDEIVGYLMTMFLAPTGWLWVIVGFVLFRLFDIWKPYPIGLVDRQVKGGLGTMLDDALAAVYAGVMLQAIAWVAA